MLPDSKLEPQFGELTYYRTIQSMLCTDDEFPVHQSLHYSFINRIESDSYCRLSFNESRDEPSWLTHLVMIQEAN